MDPTAVCAMPSGTVTFLFTDVEGSTRLWAADKDAMSASLLVHDAILRTAIESNGGYVFTTAGDSFAAAFGRASDAVRAATQSQSALSDARWPGPALRVRMGLHLGEAEERGGDYFGPTVNTAARVEAAGHGGQVLVTEAVRSTAGAPATDLGVHRLRDVGEPVRLFQLGDGDFAPLRVVDPGLSNLPVRPTRLIGRDDEVQNVRQLLGLSRLVTVTAVGGSGKTRLAIAVGEAELLHRPGGVWFVDLTAVLNSADVPAAIANGVRLSLTSGDPSDQVIRYLADKSALVILDNCEHVVDECAEFAERFLAVNGDAVLLATSREALDLDGERTISLRSLSCDTPDSPGVRLFVDRATAIDAQFQITEANAATIAAICTRLDGMPLAIELAAARITVLTPVELLAGLDDRFALLSGGRRRQRQRTLEATLDWSYDLLDADEQRVFRALGVFVDGFDVAAVAAVTETSRTVALGHVEALVAKSLVARLPRSDVARFRVLETVKAYAEDRLVDTGEAAPVRHRHLDRFHGLAAAAGPVAWFTALGPALRIRHDVGNISSAFEWAARNDDWVRASDLVSNCMPAYELYGRAPEALAMLDRSIGHWQGIEAERADMLTWISVVPLIVLDDFGAVTERLGRVAKSSAPHLRCGALAMLGWVAILRSPEQAGDLLTMAAAELDSARATNPGRATEGAAATLGFALASAAGYRGDFPGALARAEQAIAIETGIDHATVVSSFTGCASIIAACRIILGQTQRAFEILDSTARDAVDDTVQFVDGEDMRALAHLADGDIEEAGRRVMAHARQGATGRYSREANDSVLLLAALAHAENDTATAVDLLLHTGVCRSPATIIYAFELARRLDIVERHANHIRDAIGYTGTSPQGVMGNNLAMTALHRELARRG